MAEAQFSKCPVMPLKDAARYLGVRPQTISAWLYRGTYSLPHIKRGKNLFFRVEDLDEFNARHYRSPETGKSEKSTNTIDSDFQRLLASLTQVFSEFETSTGAERQQKSEQVKDLLNELLSSAITELKTT